MIVPGLTHPAPFPLAIKQPTQQALLSISRYIELQCDGSFTSSRKKWIINVCTSVSMTTSRCKCRAHNKTHINGETECHTAQLQEGHVTREDKDRFFFHLITRLFCFPQITRVTIKSHARSGSGKHTCKRARRSINRNKFQFVFPQTLCCI